MSQLQVRRIAYALGAEVRGLDCKRPLDDATVAQIRQAWLEHLLLVFPGQDLSREEFLAFAARFGELDMSGRKNLATPYMTVITERAVDGNPWNGYKDGQVWHSDKQFTLHPASGSLLNCKEIPAVGGNTMFANQYMAYEALSPAMQRLVGNLSAVHDYELRIRTSAPLDGRTAEDLKRAGDEHAANLRGGPPFPTVHPVVRAHPETGRKSLFLGRRVRQFYGMTLEESRDLLEFLQEHAVRYEFTYRHAWSLHDLIMWDNRCLLHIALSDYRLQQDPRYMIKCQLKGERSGFPETGEAKGDLVAGSAG